MLEQLPVLMEANRNVLRKISLIIHPSNDHILHVFSSRLGDTSIFVHLAFISQHPASFITFTPKLGLLSVTIVWLIALHPE